MQGAAAFGADCYSTAHEAAVTTHVFPCMVPATCCSPQVRAGNGELRERAVSQLSGGEKKRVALALALGYTQLAASRGRLSSNLLILDEVRLVGGEGMGHSVLA
jgi:hypothetical protein